MSRLRTRPPTPPHTPTPLLSDSDLSPTPRSPTLHELPRGPASRELEGLHQHRSLENGLRESTTCFSQGSRKSSPPRDVGAGPRAPPARPLSSTTTRIQCPCAPPASLREGDELSPLDERHPSAPDQLKMPYHRRLVDVADSTIVIPEPGTCPPLRSGAVRPRTSTRPSLPPTSMATLYAACWACGRWTTAVRPRRGSSPSTHPSSHRSAVCARARPPVARWTARRLAERREAGAEPSKRRSGRTARPSIYVRTDRDWSRATLAA